MKNYLWSRFVFLMLVPCLFTYQPAQASNEHEYKLESSFKNSCTEEQRLHACISAIDQRLIHVGMSVIDLDNFLGSEFAHEIPSNGAADKFSTYKFGKAEFAWRLVIKYNGQGKVVGYYLNRLTQKGYSSTEVPTALPADIGATFHIAKTPSQKLACAIHAIDTGVVRNGTPRSTLSAIFGESTEEREVAPNWFVWSFSFGTSENSWRLIFSGNSDSIFEYYLTNFDWQPFQSHP